MSDGVGIRITGREEALRVLGGVAERAANPRNLWENIGAALESSTQQRFLDERGPGGQVWPQSIRARLEGGKTLTDSARLMQSTTSNASDTGVEVGTNMISAPILHFGGTIRAKTSKGLRFKMGRGRDAAWATKQSVTIPARPFIGIDQDDETEIIAIATSWLDPGTGGEIAR